MLDERVFHAVSENLTYTLHIVQCTSISIIKIVSTPHPRVILAKLAFTLHQHIQKYFISYSISIGSNINYFYTLPRCLYPYTDLYIHSIKDCGIKLNCHVFNTRVFTRRGNTSEVLYNNQLRIAKQRVCITRVLFHWTLGRFSEGTYVITRFYELPHIHYTFRFTVVVRAWAWSSLYRLTKEFTGYRHCNVIRYGF